MSEAIDYRQRLLEETSDLSSSEIEEIYETEREATEAHERGGLPRFHSVREMAEYIEAGMDKAAE